METTEKIIVNFILGDYIVFKEVLNHSLCPHCVKNIDQNTKMVTNYDSTDPITMACVGIPKNQLLKTIIIFRKIYEKFLSEDDEAMEEIGTVINILAECTADPEVFYIKTMGHEE